MNKFQYFNLLFLLFLLMLMMILLILSLFYLHPIFILTLMIIYTILITLNLSLWKSNFLYSIMLFLIMINGLLIMFLYFTTLISNEQMKFYFNMPLFLVFFINLMLIIKNNDFMKINYFKLLNKETNSLNFINEKSFQNMLFIYKYPFNNLSISCMLYLMISLFTVIKICSLKSSSLRKIK